MKNKNTVGFIVLVVLLLTAGIFSLKLFFQQRITQDKLDIRLFPYEIAGWQGKDLEITEQEYDILETRNLISRKYVNSSGKRIYLFIIYSETNRSVFHPPEVCMMGSGLKIVDKRIEQIDSGEHRFSANKLYTQKNNYRGLALYCYKAGRLYTDNFYLQQFYFALNQLFGKNKGGATIRVSMSLKENEQTTLATLKTFMSEAVKIIHSLPAQATP